MSFVIPATLDANVSLCTYIVFITSICKYINMLLFTVPVVSTNCNITLLYKTGKLMDIECIWNFVLVSHLKNL